MAWNTSYYKQISTFTSSLNINYCLYHVYVNPIFSVFCHIPNPDGATATQQTPPQQWSGSPPEYETRSRTGTFLLYPTNDASCV